MKVSELIEKLKEFPQDMEVLIQGYEDYEFCTITKVEIKSLTINNYGDGFTDDICDEEEQRVTITYQ